MEQFWSDIERRFLNLHNEQVSEKSCLHAFKEGDAWTVGGGTQNAKQQFEWLAEHAALRLGVPPGRDPVFSWLDRLKKESPRYKPFHSNRKRRKSELDSDEMCSLEYEITQSEDGPIEFLCIASAEYCVRCDSQEQTKRDADPRIGTAMAKPAASSLTDREKKIWEVGQRVAGGRQYCRELDNARIAPPRKGVWKEGPRTYLAAYNMGHPWRHRIEDEKSKIRRKVKAAKLASEHASE